MKKLLALSLILILALPAALADGVDLSSMSYDELTDLRSQLEQEIMSRPEWKEVQVPPGRYVAGVDFPAGRYTGEMRKKYGGFMFVTLYPNAQADAIDATMYTINDDNPSVTLSFTDGMMLEIHTGGFWLKPYRGLFGE